MKEPAHLALHPFGQIPTYEEGDLALFETGAIMLHMAERPAGCCRVTRTRAIAWMFAALDTVEINGQCRRLTRVRRHALSIRSRRMKPFRHWPGTSGYVIIEDCSMRSPAHAAPPPRPVT